MFYCGEEFYLRVMEHEYYDGFPVQDAKLNPHHSLRQDLYKTCTMTIVTKATKEMKSTITLNTPHEVTKRYGR